MNTKSNTKSTNEKTIRTTLTNDELAFVREYRRAQSRFKDDILPGVCELAVELKYGRAVSSRITVDARK